MAGTFEGFADVAWKPFADLFPLERGGVVACRLSPITRW